MRKLFLLLSVASFLLWGCGNSQNPDVLNETAGLVTFANCEKLGDFLESRAGDRNVGLPFAEDGSGTAAGEEAQTSENPSPRDASSDSGNLGPVVEEADLVKREGDRLYAVSGESLFVYDVSNATAPVRIGTVSLSFRPQEIYAQNFRIVLIGYGSSEIIVDLSADQAQTHVAVYDVENASAPVLKRSYDWQGWYVDSRKVGSAVYFALQSQISPNYEDNLRARGNCAEVRVPKDLDSGDYSSYVSWSLIGLDLETLPETPNQISLVGSYGSIVTSTPEHFYLANDFWRSNETGLYLFDIRPTTAGLALRSSATVSGHLGNQFFLDEQDGILRVVSTELGFFGKNFLTTFRVSDGSFAPLGRLDTIAPGETVTSARFLGNRAFVTTFVYTDPLISIDLSDAASPRIVGELHLPGRTDYLQAWGEDRLLAVGSGISGFGGVALNLFDVSDLAHPRLVEQEEIPDAYYSEAQYEHLAFSFFENRAVLALPVERASGDATIREMSVYRVDRDAGFSRVGGVTHDDLYSGYSPALRRSLEIGDSFYTVSDAGLKVNDFSLTQDVFEEMFPGFTPPVGCGYCFEDFCTACAEFNVP